MMSHIATALIIIAVIGFTLLPLWPMVARKALWYLSCTFLLLMFVFIIVRWLLFLLLWAMGIEFWILPNFFDESLSFMDSFRPTYTLEYGSEGQGYYRGALVLGMIAFGYWAYCQPTDFDEMMKAQKSFVEDLYAGNLLPDSAQSVRDSVYQSSNPGQTAYNHMKNMPKLEDILNDIDENTDENSDSSGVDENGFDRENVATPKDSGEGEDTGGRQSQKGESIDQESEEVDLDEESADDMIDKLLANEEEEEDEEEQEL